MENMIIKKRLNRIKVCYIAYILRHGALILLSNSRLGSFS